MRLRLAARPPAGIALAAFAPHAGLPPALAQAVDARLARDAVACLDPLGLLPHPRLAMARAPAFDNALALRRRAGALARALAGERQPAAALLLSDAVRPEHLDALVGGFAQGAWAYDRHVKEPAPRPAELVLVRRDLARPSAAWKTAATRSADLAARTAACRDQVSMPAADCGPAELAALLARQARAAGVRVRLLDERACRRLGMGCLLAVGAASHRRPRLLVLELRGSGREAPLALCGKGVCFDTGGLNLKTAEGMRLMRKDMAGAATVAAALGAIAARGRPRRTVRAYLPLADNAVGPQSFRQGDVLTAMDGTTIEVGNTDAEGRLILADAIALAKAEGAGAIVSVATLTGAALVALGRAYVPLMGTDDALVHALGRAAHAAGERVWRLPLDDDYRAIVRGTATQLINDGNGEAGCITAGAFLAHFAGGVPFAHLDISPASWMAKPHDLGPAGATGVMVATLAALAAGGLSGPA